MAVRFDADGEDYTTTSGVPTTPYTFTLWLQIVNDRNTFVCFFSMDPGHGGNYTQLATQADGTTGMLNNEPGGTDINWGAITVGTWYRVGVVRDGANVTIYSGALGSALSTGSASDWTGENTPTTLRIGESVFTGEWPDARLANFKQFDAALTQTEVEAELSQYVPVRTANLARWHPWLAADTVDYSGNARTLTGGAAASTEDGPPIPWSSHAVGLILPAGGGTTTAVAEVASGTGVANDSTVTVTDAPRPVYRMFAIPRAANF